MSLQGKLSPDMTLIRRSQTGSQEAFTQIFENYKNLVFRTAYLMLDSADDAEDVLQDVFIQVHNSLGSYNPAKGAFTTWLHRITVNRCLNWRRRWKFFGASLDDLPESALQEMPTGDEHLADIESIQTALGQMSAKLRAVVILRYYWELSYAEISEILDLPLGTIKSRLNLALNTLRITLKETPTDFCANAEAQR